MATQREFWAGKKWFTKAQEEKLVEHIKAKNWVDPMKFI
jgi:hypothetical protein